MAGLSPMMEQYLQVKAQNKNSIVFFRLGDFYEMFFDDARIASQELDLTLTGRDCGLEERAPMCGVPFHSSETYIAKLVESGYSVAICEQTEDPATAKGLVKREVIRVVTPGTVIEESMLDEGVNNFLCSLYIDNGSCGICCCDASTGEAILTEISGEGFLQRAFDEIGKFSPREIIFPEASEYFGVTADFARERLQCRANPMPLGFYEDKAPVCAVVSHFGVVSPENLGIEADSVKTYALGAAVQYLAQNGMSAGSVIKTVKLYTVGQYMKLDLTAIRNLELCETMRSKSKRGSLLGVLDKTRTAMGKRLMRSWVEQPLMSVVDIEVRQNAVDELYSDAMLRDEIIEYMSGVRDITRIMSRVVYGTAGGKELRQVSDTAAFFPIIKSALGGVNSRLLKHIYEEIDPLDDIKQLIDDAIEENPPTSVRDGGIIKKGYNAEVDQLRIDIENGTDVITKIEAKERERTGIKNLRIRYNKVFGYYIEVTNSFLDKVPEDYIRKQTLTNCERFINDDLKKTEARILGARDRITSLEFELFEDVRKRTAAELERFQKTAAALAQLDVLCSLAKVAVENGYCRPVVNTAGKISIEGGRHPVVEMLSKSPFVKNDTLLDNGDNRCQIITGPNMAGKSTYMRQVAIITIMAQIGSFVPAQSATIGVVDAVYTRVGASDDLASGQSTFMVEMNEVANILKEATANSLLILDEIGRGTSTFDGMSIAKAVLEFVADKRKVGAKSLFATHYHELTTLENEIKGIKNYNIAVKKRGDDIIFLRRIVRGGADDSYGIEVAKLAGVPDAVIKRAKQILAELEAEGLKALLPVAHNNSVQISIDSENSQEIIEQLKAVDVNTLTPIEAMGILSDLTDKARKF